MRCERRGHLFTGRADEDCPTPAPARRTSTPGPLAREHAAVPLEHERLQAVPSNNLVVDHGRVIRRHELSDAEWEFVRVLLPVSPRGRKRLDDRRVLNGFGWKFRTGTAWRDVPER
ncbi:transposase [Streptomyces sp. NPDC047917]|uniref:transposase n=1 Tax=Streptomyces sp. NPDC047917 TaxID=3365491 RepID=UPI0037166C07